MKCSVPTCRAPHAHGRVKCTRHLALARKNLADRRKRGICTSCPDPAAEGRSRCTACLEYQHTYDANRRPTKKRAPK